MQFRIYFLLAIIILFGNLSSVSAQVDSILGQLSNSTAESFAGGMSGDGRFVVFESRGNLATVNPRNTDNNREIFLFDYAQRQIFQITDTVPLRNDTSVSFIATNIKVEIANVRPVISNDGRWIAFGSNATTSTPTTPNATNPGNFNSESFNSTTTPTTNPLTTNGNLEIWMYQIPAYAAADLTTGEEIPFVDLSAGTFTAVTNTNPSLNPRAATTTSGAFVADDNHDASINDNGNAIAFVSTRDLVTGGNTGDDNANDEIFTFVRSNGAIQQVTQTPYGAISNPLYNLAPTISGNGLRVAFVSNANNSIIGMTGGTNSDTNDEVYFSDLTATGAPTGTRRQLTNTVRTNAFDVLNIWNFGRRMSRDGNYIAFDSYVNLESATPSNQTSFATYLYNISNATIPAPERVGPRSTDDTAALGGDVQRYPGFTNTDANGTPSIFVLTTRENIKPDGTVATTESEGLNPNADRPVQIYSTQISGTRTFTRLTKFPTPLGLIASTQAITSNSINRLSFNFALTETGTGNFDFLSEVFYLLQKPQSFQTGGRFTLFTGATRQTVSNSPVPTPSPTATPTPTPTPTTTPSPTPTPTPTTPIAVQGVSPGMLVVASYDSGRNSPVVPRTAVGSLERSFTLPIELSGVSVTVNGAAAGIKQVSSREVTFVVPPGLSADNDGTTYQLVINNNGTVVKGDITVVAARPDIFTDVPNPIPTFPLGGRRTRVYNVTRTVPTREPFTVTTFKPKSTSSLIEDFGSKRVPTVLRIYLTGVANVSNTSFTVRIGSTTITGASITSAAVLREPGVYSVDVLLPATLNGAGDQPVVITVGVGGVNYDSRLDDTTSFIYIL